MMRTQKQRDQLILDFLPLAYRLAKEEKKARGGSIDDLRQEAAMALANAADHFDPKRGTFPALVHRAVRNHFLNLLRHNEVVTVPLLGGDVVDPKSIAAHGDKADQMQRVRAILTALSRRERRAIMLTLLRGKTLRQTGSAMRLSHETVRKLVHRGVGRIAVDMGVNPDQILGQFGRWRHNPLTKAGAAGYVLCDQ